MLLIFPTCHYICPIKQYNLDEKSYCSTINLDELSESENEDGNNKIVTTSSRNNSINDNIEIFDQFWKAIGKITTYTCHIPPFNDECIDSNLSKKELERQLIGKLANRRLNARDF